ncbi:MULTISPECIES: hypothetical protein [unclassified Cobetia]|uniref:hypothetical protein n=1 Tax=unclassified Cobetia TaxID=2609414 RepID=UPI001CF06AC2|nr:MULTISPECIES: hypothetical protein [unclassified Cobetia]MDH2447201.1 hypothetical protein [Cobetia sp. 2AS]
MKKSSGTNRSKIRKRQYRTKKFKLKKALERSYLGSWNEVEKARDNLRLLKYPRHRVVRKNGFSSNRRVRFLVPERIDYYQKKKCELMNSFLSQVKDCALDNNRKIYLDFTNTTYVSAAAMLSMLAEVDLIIRKSGYAANAVAFNHPKDPKVESILNQVGFYDLLKKNKRVTKEYEDVTFWKFTSGICSEPMLAKLMFSEIKSELNGPASKKLYRGFVEAMSNSVEHAYSYDNENGEQDKTAKWWTFAGIKDSKLTVVICDKGVGIPNTLPITQGPSKLRELFRALGLRPVKVKDSTFIKAASSLASTSTGKSNRGKGLTDIKSVIDSIGDGVLSIFSNHGRYIYKGDNGAVKEIMHDYKHSISGTIIEWSFPLKSVEK